MIGATALTVLAILAVSLAVSAPFHLLRSRSATAFRTVTLVCAGLLTAVVALGALA